MLRSVSIRIFPTGWPVCRLKISSISARTLARSHMVSSVMKFSPIQETRAEYSLSGTSSASTRATKASASLAVSSAARVTPVSASSVAMRAVIAISGRVIMLLHANRTGGLQYPYAGLKSTAAAGRSSRQ